MFSPPESNMSSVGRGNRKTFDVLRNVAGAQPAVLEAFPVHLRLQTNRASLPTRQSSPYCGFSIPSASTSFTSPRPRDAAAAGGAARDRRSAPIITGPPSVAVAA